MKFISIFILMMLSVQCFAQEDVWHAHATLGNDANDGTSWAQAELTLAAQVTDGNSNDTLLVRGDFGSQDSNLLSGNSGSVIMDSSFYAAKAWRWLADPFLMDTTILDWGTRIDRAFIANTSNVEYWGIWFDGQDNSVPLVDMGGNVGNSTYFCRFNRPEGSINRFMELEGISNKVKFCLFDGDALIGIQTLSGTRDFDVQHCTFNADIATELQIVNPTTPSTVSILRNNIMRSTTSGLNALIQHNEPDEIINDINYNIWFADTPSSPGIVFRWDDSIFLNFTDWRDSLQTGIKGIDPDAETNSLFSDPLLILGSNFGIIPDGSPAKFTASDGTNIGFWQSPRKGFVRRRGLGRTN